MNWTRFTQHLTNRYHEQPQITHSIELAVAEVRGGLEKLARFGHVFHLSLGSAPEDLPIHAPFPRTVYHLAAAPKGFRVLCQSDLELLGPGWFDSLDEAKHADGMGEQFKRGGLFPAIGLPSLISESEPIDLTPNSKLDRIEQFQRTRKEQANGS